MMMKIMITVLYGANASGKIPLFNYKSVFDNDFINGIFPEALAPYKTCHNDNSG